MRIDKKEFQKRCRDEELNSLKNMEAFWRESGKETVEEFSQRVNHWPRKREGEKAPKALLQEKLESSPILIITANQVEANMMVRLLSDESCEHEYNDRMLLTITDDGCKFHFGSIANNRIVHIQPSGMSSFTRNGSFSAIESILKRYKPKLVISLGVAFGKDATKQNLGDVLVSKQLFPYDASNKYSDGKIKLNGSLYETDSRLMCGWMDLLKYKEFPEKTGTKAFNWHCGTVLSGGSVVDEVEQKVKLLEAAEHRGIEDVVGGEMEGSGVYLACDKEKIPCVVIKGICDWGVNKNAWDNVLKGEDSSANETVKDCVQAMAFTNAFSALKCLLKYDNTFISEDGSAKDESVLSTSRLMTMRSLERIMARISAVNFLPYLLLGMVCIILLSLFDPFLLVLLDLKITSSDPKHGMTVMLTLLASTLVSVTIWISFHRMSNRYSLKPLTRKIFSVLVFGEVNAFLFTAYIYIKMFKSSFIGVHTATVYFPFVYGGFLCAGGIIWTIAKYLRTRPEDLRSTTANIVFKNLSFEKCCCIIENISETSLYSVSVGWICKTQLSPV